jgi:diphthine synthase
VLVGVGDVVGELYLVGLGLSPEYVSIKALEVLRSADLVYVDVYTSYVDLELLRSIVGRDLIRIKRADLEERSGAQILELVERGYRVALAVPGDPLVATTHVTLLVEAHRRGIPFHVVPGVSIIPTALTLSGLMVYKIGKVATVVYPKNGILYEYPYDVIKLNDSNNLHTVLLLEYDGERGVAMTVREAIEILQAIEERRGEGVVTGDRLVVALAGLGYPWYSVCAGRLKSIYGLRVDKVPQTLVVVSPKPHPVELEAMEVVSSRWCRVERPGS